MILANGKEVATSCPSEYKSSTKLLTYLEKYYIDDESKFKYNLPNIEILMFDDCEQNNYIMGRTPRIKLQEDRVVEAKAIENVKYKDLFEEAINFDNKKLEVVVCKKWSGIYFRRKTFDNSNQFCMVKIMKINLHNQLLTYLQ